ncbi:hypothetical protein TrRE_jg11741, partial [Triparma retinervis]
KTAALLNRCWGKVLVIDEAYALNDMYGRQAIDQLVGMVHGAPGEDIAVILIGYEKEMTTMFQDVNPGLSRRFNSKIDFEDFTQQELADIFRGLCDDHDCPPDSENVVAVAARQVARGRGRRGFGNAGAVRVLFEKAYGRALDRDKNAETLTLIDILGPRPDFNHNPRLKAAIDELNKLTGLEGVKQSVAKLVKLAGTNYDRELEGSKPFEMPLNRVFLGNPGCGKTTVAKIYGRILKELGLLSDGKCELKQPNDLTGSVVGETKNKTAALLNRCWGKVLVIDEAYALNDMYGRQAIDQLVGMVHG